MCPLRFILIFFSAVLAAYFAWTTLSSTTPEMDFTAQDNDNKSPSNDDRFSFIKMIKNGFWVFVDMASGRYLWRNLRSTVQLQSS